MRLNMRILTLSVVATVLVLGVAEAGTRSLPPLLRENPNARAVDPADEEPNYRLPNNTEPVHYDVDLTTNVHTGERYFKGTVKIELKVVEASREIVLHYRQIENFTASIQSKDNTGATAIPLTYVLDSTREFLTLTPSNADTSFAKDTTWILTISYEGNLRTDNGGFYLSTYTDENSNTRYLATTQFESTDARHAFPCYDEPAKRATFTITIRHDPSLTAISNMPVNNALTTSGVTVFQKTSVTMPTYLIAFIVSDFKWTEGTLNSLPQRIYSRPGTEHDQEWALVSGMLLVQRLADYYDVAFPLPKLDQVAVPDFAAGAMENWGLVTYREEYLLYNAETSTVNTQTNIANIIAHEYTHQWFGNLVAIKWWTYLWLKEGFATLFSYQATDDAYPEWGVYQMFHTDDYQRALSSDSSVNSRPMTHYVQKRQEISSLYDSISYSKAGSVLHMWQHALTNNVFRRGLHNYLTENQYSAAEEWQLFDAIARAAVEEDYAVVDPVRAMLVSWTQQAGYPILTVERNYNDGSFTVKQKAYFTNNTITSDKTWYVPINYAVQSNPDFRDTEATHYLRNTPELKVEVKLSENDWLILNKQSTGYYRINYDDRNWELITDGLIQKSHKIHPRNRAQLMHDAYSFSSSSRLKHSTLLSLMVYLKNEDQYAPWSTANSILTTFNRYLSGDGDYNHFKAYVSELVGPIYDKLGVNDIPGEQHYQKYVRSIAINLACLAGINSCLTETNAKLSAFINQGIPIEPNLQSQTYCQGLKQAEDSEYDFVFNTLMASEDQARRRILISSLGCATKKSQLDKFIASSIDLNNNLRTQERTTILSPVYSRGETGLLACIEFLNDNWEAYAALTVGTFGGSKPLDSDIKSMSQYVVNKDQQSKLLALVEKVKDSDAVNSNLESSVNSNIDANFNWLNNNRGSIMNWIIDYRTDNSVTITAFSLTMVMSVAVFISRLF